MKRHSLKTVPAVALLAFLVLSQAACPSSKDLDRMASASRELAHDTLTIEKAVAAVYTSGHMSKARKDDYASKLKSVAVRGKAFNDLLIDLDKKYPQGTVPPDTATLLRNEFAPFSALIASIIADLTSDGLKGSGKSLEGHSKTIAEVLK